MNEGGSTTDKNVNSQNPSSIQFQLICLLSFLKHLLNNIGQIKTN